MAREVRGRDRIVDLGERLAAHRVTRAIGQSGQDPGKALLIEPQDQIVNPDGRSRGVASAVIDGVSVDPGAIPLSDDGARHHLRITLGGDVSSAVPR